MNRELSKTIAVVGIATAAAAAVYALGRPELSKDHPMISMLGITSVISSSGYYIANLALK
ncbi:MAG: hypothetical protein NC548_06065 [Lachnospiraceae bacterium]|nr:hypothetical protein [Lachnospiraceae bacterium]